MFRVAKTFTAECAHRITTLVDGHKCSRLHGHTYRFEVILEAESLNGHGFIRDLGELTPLRRWIEDHLDHREINLSSEQLAELIFNKARESCPEVARVRVYEGQNIWAEYGE